MYQVLGDYTQIENLEHRGSFCAFPAALKRLYKSERRVCEGSCGEIEGLLALMGNFVWHQVKNCTLPLLFPVEAMMASWFYLALAIGIHHEDLTRWKVTGNKAWQCHQRAREKNPNPAPQWPSTQPGQILKICPWTVTIIYQWHVIPSMANTPVVFPWFPTLPQSAPAFHQLGSPVAFPMPFPWLRTSPAPVYRVERLCQKDALSMDVGGLKGCGTAPLDMLWLEHPVNSPLTVSNSLPLKFRGSYFFDRRAICLRACLLTDCSWHSVHDPSGHELFLPTYLPICLHTVPGPGYMFSLSN